ncbi:GNAT family N-acetyltransferase [Methylobacterium terricola]|nr:GNAT family N-acetyltransferase [Methylobacterium terricola]
MSCDGRTAAAPAGPTVAALAALGPAVGPIRDEARSQGVDFVRRLFEEWASGANRFDRPGEIFLGVWRGDRLVGVGGLNRDPYAAGGDIGRVRHVYLLGAHRHLGLGTLLVTRLLREAEGHFRIVRLRAASPEAAAFYRRLGFAECADPAATHLIRVRPIP